MQAAAARMMPQKNILLSSPVSVPDDPYDDPFDDPYDDPFDDSYDDPFDNSYTVRVVAI